MEPTPQGLSLSYGLNINTCTYQAVHRQHKTCQNLNEPNTWSSLLFFTATLSFYATFAWCLLFVLLRTMRPSWAWVGFQHFFFIPFPFRGEIWEFPWSWLLFWPGWPFCLCVPFLLFRTWSGWPVCWRGRALAVSIWADVSFWIWLDYN